MYKLGNSDATIINDLSIKNKIIDYLFNSIEMSKYRFNMIDNLQKLNYLKDNIHYVSPNFKGFNYFLVFISINNINQCFVIDKKKLSYHRNKVNAKFINIYRIKIQTSLSLYNGTIFDTKLVRKNNKYIMLINDCYIMMGNKVLTMEMSDKMKYINGIINTQFTDSCKHFLIKVNRLYLYEDIDEIVNKIIPKCDIDILGLVFFPKYSGITSIYIEKKQDKIDIFNNTETVSNESYHLIKNIVEFLSQRKYSYENGTNIKLYIIKTEITDVYNLYDEDTKVGIAHVPNMKTSLFLQQNIKTENKYKVNCVYNKKFDKYIPLSLIN
jgi:hypothetical protein